jgi:hypothetical protein
MASRVPALLLPVLLGIGLAGACAEWRGSLGQDCLKDDDCLSGVCAGLRCAPAPIYLNTQAGVADSGSGADATSDSTGSDAPADAVLDALGNAPGDAAMGETSADSAPLDAPAGDAPADSPADSREGG